MFVMSDPLWSLDPFLCHPYGVSMAWPSGHVHGDFFPVSLTFVSFFSLSGDFCICQSPTGSSLVKTACKYRRGRLRI